MADHAVDDVLEVAVVARDDAAEEVARARDAVGLEHLGHVLQVADGVVEATLHDLQEDEREHRIAELGGVEVGPEAGHDAAGLELLEARGDRPARDAEAPRELEHPDPRLLAQGRDDAGVEGVDRAGHVAQISSGEGRHIVHSAGGSVRHLQARPRGAEVPREVVGEGSEMFEEAQLYSPVTQGEDGTAVVHLGEEHPGFNDPAYRERRNEIATAATRWSPGEPIPQIAYADVENQIWRTVCRELRTKHEKYACREFLEAKAALGLPEDRVPQLDEVTARLQPLTGFEYHPAA